MSYTSLVSTKDPESLGTGIGALLADAIPLLPSGARRAGAARVMAARVGHDPSILVEHPIKTQLLAAGLGGALSPFVRDQHPGVRTATALAPLVLVQLLRRRELRKIQALYDKKKRRRLSELDQDELFDPGFMRLGGSSRLGAVNAYETMRKRKYRGFGSLAEAGDAIQLAAGAVNPALYTGSIPFISGIDNREADRMLKRADFVDQNNSPALPLYLAAAALSSAGLTAASRWAHRENTDTPALGPWKWSDTVRDVSGTAPLLLGTEGVGNAFFYKPRSSEEAAQFLRATEGLRDHTGGLTQLNSILGGHKDRLNRLARYGVIVADSTAGAPTIAHEAGHAKIEETPGILRALQRHVYPHSRWLAPLAGAGSLAAGLSSGGVGKGALIGTGIGALAGLGMVGPEMGASYHAMKHLGGGKLSGEATKDLLSALSTYLAATVLPSTLAGAAGGFISGRRRKREEEGEGQEKQAGDLELLTYVPDDTLESVRERGLMSGNELAKKKNRELLELARGAEAAAWLKERRQVLKERPWASSYDGPSFFFGEPDTSRFGEDHPLRRRKSSPVKVDLSRLLKDLPGTRLHGVELAPYARTAGKYSDEEWARLSDKEKDAVIDKRHRDITLKDVARLVSRAKDPKKFWRHFEAGSGRYAGDVPHVITPGGKGIPPEYLKMEKSASAYTISGDQTQGIGLRKTYHQLLEELGHDGLAVNNPHTDEVELTVDAPDPEAVLAELVRRIKAHKGKDITYTKSESKEPLQKLTVDPDTLEKLRHAHYQAYLKSEMFDPNDADIIPAERHKADLMERYRLVDTPEGLTGHVPPRAVMQLTGKEMPYSWMQRVIAEDAGVEKSAVVKQRGDKWVLLTRDGKRVLGTHDTAQEAYAQEYAIEKSKERQAETEKAAAADPLQMWKVLSRAGKIKGHLGADAADRHTLEHLGAVYRAAQGRFFKHPDVAALGVRKGMAPKTIDSLLQRLAAPPKPAGPLEQGLFDFMKQARRHPALPGLLEAKGHSDAKRYSQKGLIIRRLMDEKPGDWVIDSDDGKGIVGVTHLPTGFKIHTLRSQLPGSVASRRDEQGR